MTYGLVSCVHWTPHHLSVMSVSVHAMSGSRKRRESYTETERMSRSAHDLSCRRARSIAWQTLTAHHTQVMRSPVHARNTNRMSFIQHQGFNLTTRVGSSVLKRTRKSLKSTYVSRISPSAFWRVPFVDPNRNLRSTGYKTRAGSTDVMLTCGVTSMRCSTMASPETQI